MSQAVTAKAVGPDPEGSGPTGSVPSRRVGTWWAILTAALLTSATALVLAGAPQKGPSDFGTSAAAELPREGTVRASNGSSRPEVPVRLILPGQGVRADVVPVGTTSSGDLAVPADPHAVGWYRHGPRPGSRAGSAVLVGHVDSRSGDLGALASLASVRPGETVTVRAADGEGAHYRITARRSVAVDAFPDHVFRASGPPVLVLITCTAPFDPENGYQRLLLVTAVLTGRT